MIWPDKEKRKLMKETAALNILFVCSKNQWRSPTGEKLWARSAVVNTRSAGTSRNARRKLSVQDLRWADLILVMEEKHKNRIQADFRDEVRYKDLRVLDIEDNYRFMDDELVEIFQAKLEPILAEKLM